MTYRPPARRTSKAPRRILITLIVFVLLLVAADRVGDLVAENVAADKLRGPLGVSNLDVDIDGFPFLTQFASGKYGQIELTTDDYRVGDSGVTLNRVEASFRDVTETGTFDRIHADRVDAVATTTYQSLSDATGIDIAYAGDGRVKLTADLPIVGDTSLTVRPEVSGGALRFLGDSANDLGAIAGTVNGAVDALFGTGLLLQGLPFKVKVTDLTTTPEGLRLDLAASDVTYVR